jgi:hypothetical protein
MQPPPDKTSGEPANGSEGGDRDGAGGSHRGGYARAGAYALARDRDSADERGIFGPTFDGTHGWGRPDQGYGGGQFGGRGGGRDLPAGGYDSRRGGRPYGGENFGGTSGYGGDYEGRYGRGQHQGTPQAEFDPDYQQWRAEHLDSLDADYRRWREERRTTFGEEFDRWRKQRSG